MSIPARGARGERASPRVVWASTLTRLAAAPLLPTSRCRFHVYVCAQLLLKFSARLKKMAFEELTTFLKALPTKDWAVSDVEELLSQAFVWRTAFAGSPASLR